jgi:nitrogenase-stabilizing/protective protein
MSDLMNKLASLSQAEEFFEILDVPFDRAVINVNRLHILKRFHQYLRTNSGLEKLNEYEQRFLCRELLTRAYQDFVRSTPAQEKVFKVFQDAEGGQVSLDNVRAALQERKSGDTHA